MDCRKPIILMNTQRCRGENEGSKCRETEEVDNRTEGWKHWSRITISTQSITNCIFSKQTQVENSQKKKEED